MKKNHITVTVSTNIPSDFDTQWLTKLSNGIIEQLNIKKPIEFSILVTSNKKIKLLNKKYRNINEPTDVLSFYMPANNENFITPPDNLIHLGEIIISYEQAVKQATDESVDIRTELMVLTVHGILHLLGFDHELSGDERKMRKKEDEIKVKLAGLIPNA